MRFGAFPSSPFPFVTTSQSHHFPSSPLPIVTTSHRHQFPSSSLPFATTFLSHHLPKSPHSLCHHHFPKSAVAVAVAAAAVAVAVAVVVVEVVVVVAAVSTSITSSTAQGGGGSFKNRKPIGEVGCCESGMAKRIHWWTERCLRSRLCLSLSLTIYLPIYLLCIYLSI